MILMKQLIISALSLFSMVCTILGQDTNMPDKAVYAEPGRGYYREVILEVLDHKEYTDDEPSGRLTVDFGNRLFPTDSSLYSILPHLPPVSQGRTGACWCFATVSMLESEIIRQTGKKIRLSEIYFVFHEYLERARAFVRERGEVYFAQGSESNAVTRMMRLHGAVPYEAFPGKKNLELFHDHQTMFAEMKGYLDHVKENSIWYEDIVTGTIRAILEHYLGEPPERFLWEGEEYTPHEFAKKVLPFQPIDYFSFMSTTSMEFNQRGELKEPDNWWHSDDYYNVTLDDFLFILRNALEEGFTVTICGDVSEPGFDAQREVGIVPEFDIPGEFINEDSRELRLYNKSTTDDHCMHAVGIHEDPESGLWFMAKDSGAGGFDGPHKGYRFLHEDYVRLKMVNILVHKEAARPVLDKIIK